MCQVHVFSQRLFCLRGLPFAFFSLLGDSCQNSAQVKWKTSGRKKTGVIKKVNKSEYGIYMYGNIGKFSHPETHTGCPS